MASGKGKAGSKGRPGRPELKRRGKKVAKSVHPKSRREKGGVEYVRFSGLEKAAEFALSETLRKLTLQRMEECYPDIEPEVLEYIRKQTIEVWRKKAEAECGQIYTERDLKSKLDALDEIVSDARDRQSRRDPDVLHMDRVKPEEVVQSQLIALKEQAIRKSTKSLNSLRYHKKILLRELGRVSQGVEEGCEELDGVVGELGDLNSSQNEPDDGQFEKLIEYAVDGGRSGR